MSPSSDLRVAVPVSNDCSVPFVATFSGPYLEWNLKSTNELVRARQRLPRLPPENSLALLVINIVVGLRGKPPDWGVEL